MKLLAQKFATKPDGVDEIHFIKLVKDDITMDNVKDAVLISSMRGPSVTSLYHMFSKVYVPLIRSGKDAAS